MTKLSINKWSREQQPRERLIDNGPESLSDAELLAILIGSGNAEENAVTLVNRILDDCNRSLSTLGKKSIEELMTYKGIGEAKAVSIAAACELGRRRAQQPTEEPPKFQSATDIYKYMYHQLRDNSVEEAWIILMNNAYKLIRRVRISRGGFTETAVDVRLILKEALVSNATVLALCHNHPSGNLRPSTDDNRITEQLAKACQTMRVYFLDHVIVAEGGYYSYREQGKI